MNLIRCVALMIMLFPATGGAQEGEEDLPVIDPGEGTDCYPEKEAEVARGREAYTAGDFATALQIWRPLANEGIASAQFNLAELYHWGKGVPLDQQEAVQWYSRAAEQNDREAQAALGYHYESGTGVTQDYAEALRWYRQAAVQGSMRGQNNLGLMLAKGKGVPPDRIAGYMWLSVSAANGYRYAASERDAVAASLPLDDLAEAQRRAKVCLASYYRNCD